MIDRFTLLNHSAMARALADDLDGDGTFDNQAGMVISVAERLWQHHDPRELCSRLT